jgi:N-acetylmuramoyl-L-alanine amidase
MTARRPTTRRPYLGLLAGALAIIILATGCRAPEEPGNGIGLVAGVPLPAGDQAAATLTSLPPAAVPSSTPRPSTTPTPRPSATPSPTPRAFLVAVDPGHGGIDLGARRFGDDGKMVYHESTVNLELGLLVRDALLQRGFDVVMTRDTDRAVNEDEVDVTGDGVFDYTQDETQARVDLVNASGADLLLSIHHNAYWDPSGEWSSDVGGIQTYYCADRPFGDENLRFAQLIHETLVAAIQDYGYDIHDRGVLDDHALVTPDSTGKHLIMLGPESPRIVRPSQMVGALSEPLFITHAVEGELAREPAFLQSLAEAYADAVEAYVEGAELVP